MGKNKDKKKKGLGMEKTLAKTEKKQQKVLKKELEELGEDDVETIIKQLNEKEKELSQVKEDILPVGQFPHRRGGATFNLLPERDELILFGGDYFDGDKVTMFNDLHIYSIKKQQWTRIKAPKAPPPRTFHQSVVVSRNAGELWVFGGEFSSPSQSQFHHYNDLWMFSFQTKAWQKIPALNGPSPRSGHRMVVLKKHLLIFGGYYDNLRNCRFYNDVHLFNLETNQWEEVKFSAMGLNDQPSPRSACQLSVCSKTNSIVMYGGFSKEKQKKKDKEKGIVHSDMFVLSSEISKKSNQLEWSWKRVKQTGVRPTERISFSMITLHDDNAILFGGVFDQEEDNDEDDDDDESSKSNFYNDLYKLDLVNFKWSQLTLRGKKESKPKKNKSAEASAAANNDAESGESSSEDETEENKTTSINLDDIKLEEKKEEAFSVSFAAVNTLAPKSNDDIVVVTTQTEPQAALFQPHERRSTYLQFHKGNLYLYGGKYEDKNDREFTFNDMYCLSLKKLDNWQVLYEDKEINLEIKKSAAANMSNCSDDDWEEASGDEESDSDSDGSDMEIDAPAIEANESVEKYFERTSEVWLSQAEAEFPDEKSKRLLNRMALELCTLFWTKFNKSQNKTAE